MASSRPAFYSRARSRDQLGTGSSPASTCSTSAARTVSSIDASFTKPACKRSSCASDMASRSTPGGLPWRGLCSQRKRISAARGSVTAFSRKPRSISASVGGSLVRRVARPGFRARARDAGAGVRASYWSARQPVQRSASSGCSLRIFALERVALPTAHRRNVQWIIVRRQLSLDHLLAPAVNPGDPGVGGPIGAVRVIRPDLRQVAATTSFACS
jgi:hypothetical protein